MHARTSAARALKKAPAPEAPRIPVARMSMPAAQAITPYLEEIDAARWYSNFGPLLQRFERRLAARFGGAEIVAASSGTAALTVTLAALEAEPGAYCALPSWTFAATAHAVSQAGFRPWFVDVDPVNWMLEPARLQAILSAAPGRVGAVVPVCAFGRMADVEGWLAFRRETGVPVVFDAAAAFDAATDARVPLVVSLHATKALGVGEGGFLATTDRQLAARMRERTAFGFRGSRDAQVPATNAKLSEYAAAVGHAALDLWPHSRIAYMRAAQALRIALLHAPEIRFQPGWGSEWISSTCVVRLPDGAARSFEERFGAAGVDTRRWWCAGCHLSPAFADAARTGLPVTEQLAASTLGIPFASDLSHDDIARIAGALS